MVPEGNDPEFGPERDPDFVVFDGLDAHGGGDLDVLILSLIFIPSEGGESVFVMNTNVLFHVRIPPDGVVEIVFLHGEFE